MVSAAKNAARRRSPHATPIARAITRTNGTTDQRLVSKSDVPREPERVERPLERSACPEARGRLPGDVVRPVPEPPWDSGRDHDRCHRGERGPRDALPRPARREGDHEREPRVEQALALRQRRPGEEHRGGREAPAAPVAKPQRQQEGADDEEHVHEHVRLRRHEPLTEARDDQHEQDRRPQGPGGRMAVQAARDRDDGSRDEEPELEVERDRVGAPHRMEGGRVDDRDERRVRRPGARREHLLVEPAEEVDRLRLRHPEGPRVECLQALEAGRAEERLEQEADQSDARRGDEQGCGRGCPEPGEAAGTGAAEADAHQAGRHGPAHEREDDAPPSERDTEDEELRPQSPEGRHAEQVPEAAEPEGVRPPGEPAERPEERRAHHREPHVQGTRPAIARMVTARASGSQSPSSPSQTTSAPGNAARSHAKQRIQGASGAARRGSRK